jgi:hypothetical protein
MNLIPYLELYQEDELIYSWMFRLAKLNGISSLRHFGGSYIYPNYYLKEKRYVKYDCPEDLYLFWKFLGIEDQMNVIEFFLETSIYSAVAPFMTRSIQTYYINMSFRKKHKDNKVISSVNALISKLRICPACVKEDIRSKGFFYYHRTHQIPGVNVCYKHGCLLHLYTGNVEKEFDNPLQNSKECVPNATINIMVEYAVFAKKLLDSHLAISIKEIKGIIFSELRYRGFTAQNYLQLSENIQREGYSNLFESDIIKFLRVKLIGAQYVSAIDCMAMLLYLFKTMDNILPLIPKDEAVEFFGKLKKSNYTLISEYRSDIVELHHNNCGETYCIIPDGFVNGWHCPSCDMNKTNQEIVKTLIVEGGKGQYELLDDFKSIDSNIKLYHKKCDKSYVTKARNFIYDDKRCVCENKHTDNYIKRKIESLGDFELIDYKSTSSPLTIKHKKCGEVFDYPYHKFLKYPWCKVCKPATRDEEAFIKEIDDLVGNEYELIGPYIDKDTKVEILHHKCGRPKKYFVRHFLNGERCQYCNRQITQYEFKRLVNELSSGKYEYIGDKSRNLVLIKNNVNGDVLKPLSKYFVLQELTRKTPSKVLPLDYKNSDAKERKDITSVMDDIMVWIKERYDKNGIIFLEDIHLPNVTYASIKSKMKLLVEKNQLKRLSLGIYTFPDAKFSIQEIIEERYICRKGKRIGYYYGQSFSYLLGLSDKKPDTYYIVTNKESQIHGRDVNFLGSICHVRHPRYEVTDENSHILSLLDITNNIKKYTDKTDLETRNILKNYINKYGLTLKKVEPFIEEYPTWVELYVKSLMEEM